MNCREHEFRQETLMSTKAIYGYPRYCCAVLVLWYEHWLHLESCSARLRSNPRCVQQPPCSPLVWLIFADQDYFRAITGLPSKNVAVLGFALTPGVCNNRRKASQVDLN
jgi:hypothetical protein